MSSAKDNDAVVQIRPEDMRVDIWTLAALSPVFNKSHGVEEAEKHWSHESLLLWQTFRTSNGATKLPSQVSEHDLFSAFYFSVKADAYLNGYAALLSFMDDLKVTCQYTVDCEAVYCIYWADLQHVFPSYYIVLPLAATSNHRSGAQGYIEQQIYSMLPNHPVIRQLIDVHESIPGHASRNTLFYTTDTWWEGWKLPAQL